MHSESVAHAIVTASLPSSARPQSAPTAELAGLRATQIPSWSLPFSRSFLTIMRLQNAKHRQRTHKGQCNACISFAISDCTLEKVAQLQRLE